MWIACNYYKVLNTHSVNSMQLLQGVKYTQCEQHATITDVKLTYQKWNSKQKNHITWNSQCKINTTFQNFLHSPVLFNHHTDHHK